MEVAHHLKLALQEGRHALRRRPEALRRVFGDHAVNGGGRITDEAHVGVEVHLVGGIEDRVAHAVDAEREAVHILLPRARHILPDARHLRGGQIARAEVLAERIALRAERERARGAIGR